MPFWQRPCRLPAAVGVTDACWLDCRRSKKSVDCWGAYKNDLMRQRRDDQCPSSAVVLVGIISASS